MITEVDEFATHKYKGYAKKEQTLANEFADTNAEGTKPWTANSYPPVTHNR
jgi:hypothetical protein